MLEYQGLLIASRLPYEAQILGGIQKKIPSSVEQKNIFINQALFEGKDWTYFIFCHQHLDQHLWWYTGTIYPILN